MTKEEIIDNIARLNSKTWKDREEVRMEIGKLLAELNKALERPTCDDCVSRQAVIEATENVIGKYIPALCGRGEMIPLEIVRAIKEVPPVTPTHGTCKDCTNYVKGTLDEEICLRGHELIHENFYCADFEKRGSEND